MSATSTTAKVTVPDGKTVGECFISCSFCSKPLLDQESFELNDETLRRALRSEAHSGTRPPRFFTYVMPVAEPPYAEAVKRRVPAAEPTVAANETLIEPAGTTTYDGYEDANEGSFGVMAITSSSQGVPARVTETAIVSPTVAEVGCTVVTGM